MPKVKDDSDQREPATIRSRDGLIRRVSKKMAASPIANFAWKSRKVDRSSVAGVVLPETAFRRILVLERKRSERSGDPFLLVCLNVGALQGETGQVDPVVRDTVFSCLVSSLRETDIVGWHQDQEIAAALLTELGEASPQRIREVVVDKLEQSLRKCLPAEIRARIRIDVYFFPEESVEELPDHLREVLYPDLGPSRDRMPASRVKRVIDIIGSLAFLIAFSWLYLLIALAVKLTSRGPVLYRQRRLGQYGRPFEFLKFRSMYTNADSRLHEQYIQEFIRQGKSAAGDESGKPIFKLVQDPRVTPVGRILRKASLDELPQFFNVLKGEMSLVGPRPPIPYELKQYDVWHRRRILEVKPGITGLWQVYGRSRTTFDDMVRMDLHYARHWSLGMDLRLLALTPIAVLRGDGAM